MDKLSICALVAVSLSGCEQPTPVIEELAYTPGVTVRRAAVRAEPTPGHCGNARELCNGVCVRTRNDPNNCGACGYVCPHYQFSTSTCSNAVCIFAQCIAGHADCDGDNTTGCEVAVSSDPANCGSCGHACSPGVLCVDGRCDPKGCGAGTDNCDGNADNGCETNTAFDRANCGACGITCAVEQLCVDGVCRASPCDPSSEVEIDGHCYYLDGSGGVCDPGYQLAPQSVLTQGMFSGKTYKHQISDNCCVYNAEPDEDWGMGDHCNEPGPFSLHDPERGAIGCTNATELWPAQLTLCYN